jgi:hypothetical protein
MLQLSKVTPVQRTPGSQKACRAAFSSSRGRQTRCQAVTDGYSNHAAAMAAGLAATLLLTSGEATHTWRDPRSRCQQKHIASTAWHLFSLCFQLVDVSISRPKASRASFLCLVTKHPSIIQGLHTCLLCLSPNCRCPPESEQHMVITIDRRIVWSRCQLYLLKPTAGPALAREKIGEFQVCHQLALTSHQA